MLSTDYCYRRIQIFYNYFNLNYVLFYRTLRYNILVKKTILTLNNSTALEKKMCPTNYF